MNEQKDGTDSRVLSTAALEMAAIKVSLTDWIGDFLWYWGNESSPIGEQDVAEMLVCVIARHHELSVQGLGFPFPGAKGLFEAIKKRTRKGRGQVFRYHMILKDLTPSTGLDPIDVCDPIDV